jgi:polyisoprenoid-binding protein YceI
MTTELVNQIERYRFDPAVSNITAQAFAAGLLSAFGHDPLIGTHGLSGEVRCDAETYANGSLKIEIDAQSLTVIGNVAEKDRSEVERVMHEDVLETTRYPAIEFESNNVWLSRVRPGRFRARVIGDLNLHGVRKTNLWIDGEVMVEDGALRAKGEFSVKQSDYQIKLVSVVGGAMKIKDEVKCMFDVRAQRVS